MTKLSPQHVRDEKSGKDFGLTFWLLQQTDVIQLTDGGERFCAALQLTAKVEVAYPVPAHRHNIENYIYCWETVRKYQLGREPRRTRDCGRSLPWSPWRTGLQEDEPGETAGARNPN